jgi:hypothetical protein
MKADDELKELLGGMFKDFESNPHPQAWERIEGALSKVPSTSMWPKIVTGALVGLFFASVCHAPVHSQLAQWQAKTKSNHAAVSSVIKEPFVVKKSNKSIGENLKEVKNKLVTLSLKTTTKSIFVEWANNELIKNQETFIRDGKEELNVNINQEEKTSTSVIETKGLSPELLEIHSLKELPVLSNDTEVKTPRLVSKRSDFVKLWSVSIMPLATYQRMYVVPEANEQIRQIHSQQSLNANRTGIRLGSELTLLRERSAWRFGLSFTQMRQQTEYTLAKNSYTLSTAANLSQPSVSQQTEQVNEVSKWNLLGIRADRQYQLNSNGRQRYFVSLGTEGALELSSRQPYVWGHLSVGMQKLLTPRVWMSVEPTASYSLVSKTTTNGLLRVNPYNFGVKISLGILP